MALGHIKKQWCAALVLLLGSGLSTEAHLGDRVYPISYLSDEMLERIDLKDGLVDEWYELVGEPSMTLLDFTEELYQSPLDPADIDFRIWLAWHDEPARLYVAFVASDDVYKNTHDCGRRSAGHLGDRAVRDAVRPLGGHVGKSRGERGQPFCRGTDDRFYDGSV